MKAIHKKRLLNVAKALRDSPNPEKFTMEQFAYHCGTPACAVGHYAARRDLQKSFKLKQSESCCSLANNDGEFVFVDGPTANALMDHFGLKYNEVTRLFGEEGCRKAKRPLTAAKYIERFVAKQS